MKSELQKLKDGELYDYTDPEVRAAHIRAVELCDEYNETKRTETEKRDRILRELFGSLGENALVEKNIRIDYGFNVHAGDNFFVNYDCVFLDCAPITFGNNVFIAPQCGFYAVNHPLEADLRNSGVETGVPITVGDDVWIGGGVKVMPGVTIGSNVVIGGGISERPEMVRNKTKNAAKGGISCEKNHCFPFIQGRTKNLPFSGKN